MNAKTHHYLNLYSIDYLYQYVTSGANLGKIGEYCAATEEWPQYAEHFRDFLITNKVMEEEIKHVMSLPAFNCETLQFLTYNECHALR